MPKRVIDFDAMWGSDKLASCAEWAQAEYAWLYGLADASGCFELTNLRVIWGRVAAIRRNLTIERLEQIFVEFQDKGLLFVWEHEGKRYGHWTGSDVPGRLPPPSWRMRLERLAPPVPKQLFAEYVSRFARGRASLAGVGFRGAAREENLENQFEISNLKSQISREESRELAGQVSRPRAAHAPITPNRDLGSPSKNVGARDSGGLQSLNGGLEEAHAEDWNLDWDRGEGGKGSPGGLTREEGSAPALDAAARAEAGPSRTEKQKSLFTELNSNSGNPQMQCEAIPPSPGENRSMRGVAVGASSAPAFRSYDKAALVARELAVGQGPRCGPVKVKPEALERMRARDAALRGSRSP